LTALIAVAIVVADQATKHWALNALGDGRTIDIVGSLRFNLAFNTGMAFAKGQGIGPIIAVVGVAVAVSGRWSAPEGVPVLAVVVAFGAGMLSAVQQALNGRVTQRSGSALSATWINFLLGLAILAVVLGTSVAVGRVDVDPIGGAAPWLYASGVVGVSFIALAAWAVPRIGVLVTALLAVAGQLTSALLLDLLLPTTGTAVSAGLVVGLVLAFLAVWLGFRGRVGR